MSIIDDSILGGGTSGFGGGSGVPPPPGSASLSSASSVSSPAGVSDQNRIRALIRKRYIGLPPPPANVIGLQPFQAQPAGQTALAAPSPAPLPAMTTGYSNPGSANYGSGFFGSLSELLRGFQGSGAFAPGPNQGILDLIRAYALMDADAARAHSALAAQSLGADPATAASYGLRADLNAQGGVADALNRATLSEATHQRDFGQQLLLALLGRQGTQNAYNPQRATDVIGSLGGLLPRGSYNLG